MGETLKRLHRKTAASPRNYADVLVLNMVSWMPYLCLQDNSFIQRRPPSEFTWDSVKCLRCLYNSMNDVWETFFSVKLHIACQHVTHQRYACLCKTHRCTCRVPNTKHTNNIKGATALPTKVSLSIPRSSMSIVPPLT